jgi:hypothetical protein
MFLVLLSVVCCLPSAGCGYTTRTGLASHIRSVYVKPFTNKIDMTNPGSRYQSFPVYSHALEVDITNALINQFQINGLLRPVELSQADVRIEGDLVEFRQDALRFSNSNEIEQWRLNVVANVRLYDVSSNEMLWAEDRITGDHDYITIGPNAETEASALQKAIQDLARRVVERTVESW